MNETSMLIYGPVKIGKTTFAGTAPNPFILDFENKAEKSIDPKRSDVTLWKECGSFKDICKGIKTALDKGNQTIVFDTITEMANVIMRENMREAMRETNEGDDYDYVFWKFHEILSKLTERSVPFILLAHETVFNYARNHPKRRPSLPGQKLQMSVSSIPHLVGYMYAQDSGERAISIRTNQDYECGFNCPTPDRAIPEFKPDYKGLLDFIVPKLAKKVART